MSLESLLNHHYELGRFIEQERWANQEHDRTKDLYALLFMAFAFGVVIGVVLGVAFGG
jgi:uncharacterized membrane protein YoaK (UPF0700 family)